MKKQIENKRKEIGEMLLREFSTKEANLIWLKINELINMEIDLEETCNA